MNFPKLIVTILLLVPVILCADIASANTTTESDYPEDGFSLTDWWVIGPVHSGPREPLTTQLPGILDPETGTVDLDATYPSIYEFGGRVAWQPTSTNEDGNLVFNFDNPDWEKLNDEWGVSGIYFIGAAYTSFESPARMRALVNANGIGTFYINGRRYSGDPYGHRLIQTPVIIDEGINHVFFMTGGFAGGDSVKFEIIPPSETAIIVLERDIMIGDVIRGDRNYTYAGIPLLNTTEEWISGIDITYEDPISMALVTIPVDVVLPPFTPIKVPIMIEFDGDYLDYEEETVDINLLVEAGGQEVWATATSRVRNPEDSRLVTFISRNDGSVQKYGLRLPIDYDPALRYAMIISTHGAGVECQGQVDAFEARDWAFIVAPTNRRRFGFDWQDWGRLDAIEVLETVKDQYRIDENRVYLIGHSMGGHGAWHIGCTHADRFAAVVPSAGWTSFQLYVPWFLRSDHLFADPEFSIIFEQLTSADRTERILPNLRNVPVLAVHGGDDDNVPPTHARLLIGTLERMGYDARLWEEPGQGHWWDAHPGIPGADCVDGLRIRTFCRERERNPYPEHVTFVGYDLGNNDSLYWVKVLQYECRIGAVSVDAEFVDSDTLIVETSNVQSFALTFDDEIGFGVPRSLIVDGMEIGMRENTDSQLVLIKDNERWSVCDTPDAAIQASDYAVAGPIKRAYYEPFVIVVGQNGSPEENAQNMEIARSIAERWWYRANGFTQIITDSEAISDPGLDSNLILIGGPETNRMSDSMRDSFPITQAVNGYNVGDELIEGEDLACHFVYPVDFGSGPRLVHCIWGTSIGGMRLAGGLTPLYSGSNLPDFLVYDDEVRLMGYAGVRGMGLFGNDWELDPDSMYIRN